MYKWQEKRHKHREEIQTDKADTKQVKKLKINLPSAELKIILV